jgi:energy-coupling factor transporter ATP-binding protein EcfA2
MSHIVDFTVDELAGKPGPYSQKLDRHVNVFFGLNGSGKTSLLKILHSAMSGAPSILESVPFKSAEVRIYSVAYDRIFTHTCKKAEETQPTNIATRAPGDASFQEFTTLYRYVIDSPSISWEIDPPVPDTNQSKNAGWAHRYLPISRLYVSDSPTPSRVSKDYLTSDAGLSEEQLEQSFARLVNQLWSSYSAGVLGAVEKVQARGLADILKAVLSGPQAAQQTEKEADFDWTAAYHRVTRFLERQGSKGILGDQDTFGKTYRNDPLLRKVISDVNSVELKLQETVAPRDRIQSLIEQMFTGNKKVVFKDNSIEITGLRDAKIGLSSLSSGEKQLIRILIDTLLVESSSLILDEPEISMHVDWQRRLIGAMRQLSPDAQLIVATHAPEIMAEIEDKNIFRL